jgi:hypothetical protein
MQKLIILAILICTTAVSAQYIKVRFSGVATDNITSYGCLIQGYGFYMNFRPYILGLVYQDGERSVWQTQDRNSLYWTERNCDWCGCCRAEGLDIEVERNGQTVSVYAKSIVPANNIGPEYFQGNTTTPSTELYLYWIHPTVVCNNYTTANCDLIQFCIPIWTAGIGGSVQIWGVPQARYSRRNFLYFAEYLHEAVLEQAEVKLADLADIFQQWLCSTCETMDLNNDGLVNFGDYAADPNELECISQTWLRTVEI